MMLTATDGWTIALATCCALACALPGVFLVLRRMSMLGDAISHAILPGLAAAFILSGTRDVGWMLLGAGCTGLLTAWASSALARFGRVPHDAAMGVVFTTLFALGVLLISLVARDVDLDPGCILYGQAELAAIDTTSIAGISLPRTFPQLALAAGLNALLIAIFYKELKITSFDPALAITLGISSPLVHAGLMTAVSATTVVSFEAVGAVLVVSMLIAPGATAQLLTTRLPRMLVLAGVSAIISAVAGYLLALAFNTNMAGMMSVVAGVQFVLALVFAPKDGLVPRGVRRLLLSFRIAREDVLGALYRAHEANEAASLRPATGGQSAMHTLACAQLRLRGYIAPAPRNSTNAEHVLTPAGLAKARRIISSHRLWETFLAERLGLPVDHVHEPSERMEHFVTPEIERSLREEFEGRKDPQGKEIPR